MIENCENCEYWKKITKIKFEGNKKDAGQCRKHPPRIFFSTFESSPRQVVKYRFPFAANDDWCGEYKPKDEQKEKVSRDI